MILVHNHPSGDAYPNNEDISIIERLSKAGELIDIRVLDHIVVGAEDEYYSFKQEGSF